MARRKEITPIGSVEVALESYDETYLECRNLGHVWRILGYFRGAAGNVVRHLRCQRCETIRVDRWGLNGDRIGASYHHSEGYLFEGLEAPVNAHAVRIEMLHRATIFENEASMLASLETRAPRRPRRAS